MSPLTDEALDKSKSGRLVLQCNGKDITTGQKLEKQDAKSALALKIKDAGLSTSYLAFAIDPDAPFPSAAFLSPIVHWIQPDLRPGSDGILQASASPAVDWLQAIPPPFSAPHKYIVLLYEQPESFDAARWTITSMRQRFRWNPNTFVKEAGLGPLVAANYFTI